MADSNENQNPNLLEGRDPGRSELDSNNPVVLAEQVYHLWWNWADFHLYIISPHSDHHTSPNIIEPDNIAGSDEQEFVYRIHDWGDRFSTSKGEDLLTAGMSMCRLFFTIEKMIALLIERIEQAGGDGETEVRVAFGGHLLGQRKAFESIINLNHNVVVTNFDPGSWGENYLQTVKRIAAAGYGFPPEAPRASYKQAHGRTSTGIKR